MNRVTYSDASRRYRWAFLPAMAAYAVLLIGGTALVAAFPEPVWLRVVAAMPIAVALWALLRFTGETDDFGREMLRNSLSIAGAAVMGLAAIAGFAQSYGLVPGFDMWVLVPVYFLVFGIAQCLAGRVTQAPGEENGGGSC
jgi:hypothetical protein